MSQSNSFFIVFHYLQPSEPRVFFHHQKSESAVQFLSSLMIIWYGNKQRGDQKGCSHHHEPAIQSLTFYYFATDREGVFISTPSEWVSAPHLLSSFVTMNGGSFHNIPFAKIKKITFYIFFYSLCLPISREITCSSCYHVIISFSVWYIKGIVSRDEYFVQVLKFETVLFEWALMVFTIFSCLFCEGNPKWSFCLLLWNHLLIVKFLPVTLFRELVPAFWWPPVPLKVVPKRLWFWKLFRKPAMNVH